MITGALGSAESERSPTRLVPSRQVDDNEVEVITRTPASREILLMSSSTPLSRDPSAPVPLQDGVSLLERETPPMVLRAQAAFRRDLPQLLEGHRFQWVAYHGDRRVALGRSKRE